MDRPWHYSKGQIKWTWCSLQTTYTITTPSMRHTPLHEATDEHKNSWLGAHTLGLQHFCTWPTVQGSVQTPPRATLPYSCSREHNPQTRGCGQCHGALLRPKSMRSGRGLTWAHNQQESTVLWFIHGFKSATLTSSLHVHLGIFCPVHISLRLSLIF